MKKRASKVAHNRPRPFYFTVQPRPTAHSLEWIFHIIKSWDQTSHNLFSYLWISDMYYFVAMLIYSATMKNSKSKRL